MTPRPKYSPQRGIPYEDKCIGKRTVKNHGHKLLRVCLMRKVTNCLYCQQPLCNKCNNDYERHRNGCVDQ